MADAPRGPGRVRRRPRRGLGASVTSALRRTMNVPIARETTLAVGVGDGGLHVGDLAGELHHLAAHRERVADASARAGSGTTRRASRPGRPDSSALLAAKFIAASWTTPYTPPCTTPNGLPRQLGRRSTPPRPSPRRSARSDTPSCPSSGMPPSPSERSMFRTGWRLPARPIVPIRRCAQGDAHAHRRHRRRHPHPARAPQRQARRTGTPSTSPRTCCEALVERNDLDPALVDDVIMGCVMQVGEQALNIGRNAALAAGLPRDRCAAPRRPPVRVVAAGRALRRAGRDRRRVRRRDRRRRREHEPRADGRVGRRRQSIPVRPDDDRALPEPRARRASRPS